MPKKTKKKKKAVNRSSRKTAPKKKVTKKATKKKPVNAWQIVGRLQLAKLIGVHPDTISDYASGGMPVITRGGHGRQSKYDAVKCLAWWREQQGQNAKEVAQTRAYKAQAELNELKLARERKELYPGDEILRAGQQHVKAWTAKIRALPWQLVQAGIVSREAETRISDFLRDLLIEISNWKTVDDVKKVAGRKR